MVKTAIRGCAVTLTRELHPDWANFVGRAEEAWARMIESLATALEVGRDLRARS